MGWAFKGGHKRKWCADDNIRGQSRIRCNRGAVGQWEKFTVTCKSGCNNGVRKYESAVRDKVVQQTKTKLLRVKEAAIRERKGKHKTLHRRLKKSLKKLKKKERAKKVDKAARLAKVRAGANEQSQSPKGTRRQGK